MNLRTVGEITMGRRIYDEARKKWLLATDKWVVRTSVEDAAKHFVSTYGGIIEKSGSLHEPLRAVLDSPYIDVVVLPASKVPVRTEWQGTIHVDNRYTKVHCNRQNMTFYSGQVRQVQPCTFANNSCSAHCRLTYKVIVFDPRYQALVGFRTNFKIPELATLAQEIKEPISVRLSLSFQRKIVDNVERKWTIVMVNPLPSETELTQYYHYLKQVLATEEASTDESVSIAEQYAPAQQAPVQQVPVQQVPVQQVPVQHVSVQTQLQQPSQQPWRSSAFEQLARTNQNQPMSSPQPTASQQHQATQQPNQSAWKPAIEVISTTPSPVMSAGAPVQPVQGKGSGAPVVVEELYTVVDEEPF
jgi:hypothetical protein